MAPDSSVSVGDRLIERYWCERVVASSVLRSISFLSSWIAVMAQHKDVVRVLRRLRWSRKAPRCILGLTSSPSAFTGLLGSSPSKWFIAVSAQPFRSSNVQVDVFLLLSGFVVKRVMQRVSFYGNSSRRWSFAASCVVVASSVVYKSFWLLRFPFPLRTAVADVASAVDGGVRPSNGHFGGGRKLFEIDWAARFSSGPLVLRAESIGTCSLGR